MAAMLMCNNTMMGVDFCYSNTTTSTTTDTVVTPTSSSDDAYFYDWNDFTPVVDWGEISEGSDDFQVQELIESMIDCETTVYHDDDDDDDDDEKRRVLERCDSVVLTETQITDVEEDAKGLRLVHLLMAAAEALTGINRSSELARVILVRLKDLVSINDSTNIERLTAYFTDALQILVEGSGSGGINSKKFYQTDDVHHKSDVLAAFQLLQDMSPYVNFGHFTANQAILEAVENHKRIHILDYDIMEGIQWPSLMQSLVSQNNGTQTPHLRITAISRGSGNGRRSFGTIQQTRRRLTEFAKSIGLPFSFNQCRLDSNEKFSPNSLKSLRGETLIVNCMLHLPHFNHRPADSIASFLSGIKTLKPRLITLVEEEVSPTTTEEGFLGRFMESLHHYSAIYDSLEAGFPMQCQARTLIERVFLGPQIAASIAQIFQARTEDDCSSWGEKLINTIGLCPNDISFANNCQAKLLLGLFNHGYRVEKLSNNKLVLCWKSRRLLSASVWRSYEDDI